MPVSVRSRTIGGDRLKRFLRNAKSAQGKAVRAVEVGFFEDARYSPVKLGKGQRGKRQKPHPVALVAAWNEYGTRAGGWGGPTPERPFFRRAIAASKRGVGEIIEDNIDTGTMVVDPRTAKLVGAYLVGQVQSEIVRLDDPENAPVTKKIKGRDSPLIDTGFMLQSVTFRTE